jgi:hypothetical protein
LLEWVAYDFGLEQITSKFERNPILTQITLLGVLRALCGQKSHFWQKISAMISPRQGGDFLPKFSLPVADVAR